MLPHKLTFYHSIGLRFFDKTFRLPCVRLRSVATGVNERPVDVQSRGVTEPQRDAGSEAD